MFKIGIASRLRGYELAVRKIDNGTKVSLSLSVDSHTNVLLQQDAHPFWRLRASYPRAIAGPV